MTKRAAEEMTVAEELKVANLEPSAKAPKPPLKKGTSTMFLAAEWGQVEELEVLLQDGMDPNSLDPDDDPVLFTASMKGHTRVIKALLDAKADPKAKNDVGFTALMIAVRSKRHAAAKMLLEAGCDKDAKNALGETALDLARKESCEECTELLEP
mmetsp:Transcript_5390/g.12829  ORF Transcript_5390/g.12829 Transcript_5390/m.12829 type:complete len:155 (-) Transcript_5390:115-579(-)